MLPVLSKRYTVPNVWIFKNFLGGGGGGGGIKKKGGGGGGVSSAVWF